MSTAKRTSFGEKEAPVPKRAKTVNAPAERILGFGREPASDEIMDAFTSPKVNGFPLLAFVNVTAAKLFDVVRVMLFLLPLLMGLDRTTLDFILQLSSSGVPFLQISEAVLLT